MDVILRVLVALFAALPATSGTPQGNVPTFTAPSSLAPIAINATQLVTSTVAPEHSVEITGTVSTIAGTTITLSSGVTLTVGVTTEVKGNLQPGAVVQVEGQLQPDGTIIALEIKAGGATSGETEDHLDLNTDEKIITGTLTLTRTEGIEDDKVITATKTITDDKSIDDKEITRTLTLTNTENYDNHEVITGTISVDDKHRSHHGDDPSNSQSSDNNTSPVIIGNMNSGQSKPGDNQDPPRNVSTEGVPSQGSHDGGDRYSQGGQSQGSHTGGDD